MRCDVCFCESSSFCTVKFNNKHNENWCEKCKDIIEDAAYGTIDEEYDLWIGDQEKTVEALLQEAVTQAPKK